MQLFGFLYWWLNEEIYKKPGLNGFFTGKYSQISNSVSITGGGVFLDPSGLRGNRIGTYLMYHIVSLAKYWPNAEVENIKLDVDETKSENKIRRNKLYEQIGLVFDYSDPKNKGGISRSMPVEKLIIVENWKKI